MKRLIKLTLVQRVTIIKALLELKDARHLYCCDSLISMIDKSNNIILEVEE